MMLDLEDKEAENRTTIIPHARKLEQWKPPISTRQSKARLRNLVEEFRRRTERTVYEMGMELKWLKERLPHGEFTTFVMGDEIKMHIRTAQRLMKHADECNMVNRYLPYAPSKSGKSKRDTVSLLEPPKIEDKSELEIEKPDHEPLAWSAYECAQRLLVFFEKLTRGHSVEEMRDVVAAFNECVEEYINEREEGKQELRGVKEFERDLNKALFGQKGGKP